ncbi:acyl-CoA dehydrogenase family protein [Pacificimonas sp. ICDLI1SI03]
MRTVARSSKDSFVLNGTKTWTSNAPFANLFVVWAKSKHMAVLFVVSSLKKGMKRLSVPIIDGELSLRASTTGMIVLEDLQPDSDAFLPGLEGLKGPFECLKRARYVFPGVRWGPRNSACRLPFAFGG